MQAEAPEAASARPSGAATDAAGVARASNVTAGPPDADAAAARAAAPSAVPGAVSAAAAAPLAGDAHCFDAVHPFPSPSVSASAGADLPPAVVAGSAAMAAPECRASGRLLRLAQQLQQPQTLVSCSTSSMLDLGRLPFTRCFSANGSSRMNNNSPRSNKSSKRTGFSGENILSLPPMLIIISRGSSVNMSFLPSRRFVEICLQGHIPCSTQTPVLSAGAVLPLSSSQSAVRRNNSRCGAAAIVAAAPYSSAVAAAGVRHRFAAAAARRRAACTDGDGGSAAAAVSVRKPHSTVDAAPQQHAFVPRSAGIVHAFFSAVAAVAACPSAASRAAAAAPPRVPSAAAVHASAATARGRTTGRGITAGPARGYLLSHVLLPISSFSWLRSCLSFRRVPSLPSFRSAVGHAFYLPPNHVSLPAASSYFAGLSSRVFPACDPLAAAAYACISRRAAAFCCSASSAVNRSTAFLSAAPAHPLRLSIAVTASEALLTQQRRPCCMSAAAAVACYPSSSYASFVSALQNERVCVSVCASLVPCRCISSSSSSKMALRSTAACVAPAAASPSLWEKHTAICEALQQSKQQQQQQTRRSFSVVPSFPSSFLKRTCCSSNSTAKYHASSTSQSAATTNAAAFAPSLAGPQAAWKREIIIEWLPQHPEAPASPFSSNTKSATASTTAASSHSPAFGPSASAPCSTGPPHAAAPAAAAAAAPHPHAAASLSAAGDSSSHAAAAAAPLSAAAAAVPTGGSGCVGVCLNRPQQHNALTLDMVLLLKQLLRVVDRDPRCSVILVQGTGDKAFCAGGDVKRMHGASLHEVQRFFGTEYAMDFLTSQMQKPYVAIWTGFVMGGGVGLSCFAPYRVCTNNTQWAMPESAIGLFPDVGVSFFLLSLLEDKFPGLSLYIGLTGVKLRARDLRRFGIATHYVQPEQLDNLRSGLQRLPGGLAAAAAHEEVQKVLHAAAAQDDPPQDLSVISDEILEGCREFLSLQRIPRSFKALHATLQQKAAGNQFCRLLLQELSGRCPLSCAVWQQILLRVSGVHGKKKKKGDEAAEGREAKAAGRGREGGGGKRLGMQLLETFEQDFRLVQALTFFHSENFKEGVRAALIAKDKNPRWSPAKVEDLDDDFVESLFSCRDAEQTLERYLIS